MNRSAIIYYSIIFFIFKQIQSHQLLNKMIEWKYTNKKIIRAPLEILNKTEKQENK